MHSKLGCLGMIQFPDDTDLMFGGTLYLQSTICKQNLYKINKLWFVGNL